MAVLCLSGLAAYSGEKRELGWVEHARILPENVQLRAKLDTGANTSSIDANHLAYFDRNGRPWVRFVVDAKNGSAMTFERPIVRVVQVKRSDSATTIRPVVMLTICLGGEFRDETVTLVNRSHLRYPLLIGRATMEKRFVVNPSRKDVYATDCLED